VATTRQAAAQPRHSPQLVGAEVLDRPWPSAAVGGMEAWAGRHRRAPWKEGIHQPVGQGLQASSRWRPTDPVCRLVRARPGWAAKGDRRAGRLALQPLLQLRAKHHVGQLALAVGAQRS